MRGLAPGPTRACARGGIRLATKGGDQASELVTKAGLRLAQEGARLRLSKESLDLRRKARLATAIAQRGAFSDTEKGSGSRRGLRDAESSRRSPWGSRRLNLSWPKASPRKRTSVR